MGRDRALPDLRMIGRLEQFRQESPGAIAGAINTEAGNLFSSRFEMQ
jgi:hypothetical protein